MSGFARFVPFSTTPPTLSLPDHFHVLFDYVFLLLWAGKWLWLLGPRWTALEILRFGIGMFLVLCAFSSLSGGVLRRTVEEAKKGERLP